MRKKLLTVFFLLSISLLLSASDQTENKSDKPPENKITLAVPPPKIISEDKADSSLGPVLSSFLMDEMNKSTVFKVIDLEMSDQVEKLLAFANSDKCDQNQCHIPVGNIIPAQKLLAGTLSRLGKVYVLNVRLIDIEKNVVEFSAKEQMTGEKEDLVQLTQLVAIDVREHFGEKVERPHVSNSTSTPSASAQTSLPAPSSGPGPMVSVPAGEFMMGCNEQVDKKCSSNEKPYHKVYLDAFNIDKFEVTQSEYNDCVSAGECTENKKFDGFTSARQPVVGVSWIDAQSYCSWAGKRLPTEAEWEKAARGTDGRIYPWGNTIDSSRANYSASKTVKVGSYQSGASPYGALDMAGTVWEWVADWYDAKYYSNSPSKNPQGPDSGKYRVMRGGSWIDDPDHLRVSYRGGGPYILWVSDRLNNLPPHQLYNYGSVGVRCARD